MKHTKYILVALIATVIGLAAVTASGQVGAAVGSTNAATTLSWAIVPAGPGTPVVNFLSATSDKGASVAQFYKVNAATLANGANSTTSVPVAGTNGLVDEAVLLIRHMAVGTYEKVSIDSLVSTNIVLDAAPQTAVAAGDVVYQISKTGAPLIPVGVATLTLYGENLYVGQEGYPIYVEVDGGTNATLNAISVKYQ
jgi:hypothetical protein